MPVHHLPHSEDERCFISSCHVMNKAFQLNDGQRDPYPDHMVDGVDVTVTGVHPDGPQCEAKLLS